MSRPQIFLCDECDDEETSVDARRLDRAQSLCQTELIDPAEMLDPGPRLAGSEQPRVPFLPRFERKSLVIGGVLLASICVLATLVYEQRQNAQALHKAIEQIGRVQANAVSVNAAEPTRDRRPLSVDRDAHPAFHDGPPDAERLDLELRGADLLVANDYPGALAHYRALADRFPGETAFLDIVTVLESKQRCVGSSTTNGETCR